VEGIYSFIYTIGDTLMNNYMRKKLSLQQQPNEHDVTVQFLKERIVEQDIQFKYFITMSYYSPVYTIGDMIKENKHVKMVMLKYFYNNIPTNKIRIWFFIEKHASSAYHSHILMEGLDDRIRMRYCERNSILFIPNTDNIIMNTDEDLDEEIMDGLRVHLQEKVKRLGKGSGSLDIRDAGEIDRRLGYVNKTMRSGISELALEGYTDKGLWDHIDWMNSDM
jgi:hypothetical protein